MVNELQSLSLIFQNKLFRIPDYQRGYAWQLSQLVDFWDDLINLQQDKYHYTGLLSLKLLDRKEINNWGYDLWMVEKGFKAYHIVDGQQRLTTFVILLNEIICFVRELAENKGKKDDEIVLGYDTLKDIVSKYICQKRPQDNMITTYLFGYEADNPSADYLRHKIFGEAYSGTINETYYTKNLKFAKKFFKENLTTIYKNEGMAGINTLYLKLTLKLMFNIHVIDDDYDVFVAFETMNNRGKKLTNLELLKNRLIYLTTLYSDKKFDETSKSYLRKEINDAWKEIYFQLGKNENVPLSDDDFLRAHWIIYFAFSRKKGDDYIHFLLNKFSAQNIFEKKTVMVNKALEKFGIDADCETEDDEEATETETAEPSKLEPTEIKNYVNSLKDMAKYWYDTFFPYESKNLAKDEQLWVDKLNRIGMGYFRPLVAVIISRHDDFDSEERIKAFKAIERFIFICFRLGSFNGTFGSSEYYRAARSLYLSEISLEDIMATIVQNIDNNIEYAISNFESKIDKQFLNGKGFYGWNNVDYFLYEYETSLVQKNNIDRICSWEMFTKKAKDKVSIEHILPQTPSKYYWQNLYRQFTDGEIEMLSGALGNLLPLSQSVNSSLQNDSFYDKKTTRAGRRGYENGCHSEIEVSKSNDWNAENIYARSKKLLEFMEKRWGFKFTEEQLEKLIHVNFAVDGRAVPEELPVPEEKPAISKENQVAHEYTSLEMRQKAFWINFIRHCSKRNRKNIIKGKATVKYWYDSKARTDEFLLQFAITYGKYVSLVIYAFDGDAFKRLESKKHTIESKFGDKLDWYSSRETSIAKRIVYQHEADVFNLEKQQEIFDWMIEKFDLLVDALKDVGELENKKVSYGKFFELKKYLKSCDKDRISLTFAEIENIIGNKLSKSAYTYREYWSQSKSHTMANTIVEAGYEIISVDLKFEKIDLAKKK